MSHATCPYRTRPDDAFWKRAVAGVAPSSVDPVSTPPFQISIEDKVATAGSCFAQHIARYLKKAGVTPLIAEQAPSMIDAETAAEYQYGVYSARYGNLYTTRQLVQLFDRAYGEFQPVDAAWKTDGRYFDPYRPSVQPSGFLSREELELDRAQHLGCVRRMFEELDVFVYTLGLTEAWYNRQDGAVYPVCPGCGWGTHDANQHEFMNFSVDQVFEDLDTFIKRLRLVNPASKIILTVSPVPLAATAEHRHVLESTVLSKSILRVAADMAQGRHEDVAYFPSYEIITGAFNRGAYYDTDLRTVLPEGVEHVMRTFFRAFLPSVKFTPSRSHASNAARPATANHTRIPAASSQRSSTAGRMVDLICEEDELDPAGKS